MTSPDDQTPGVPDLGDGERDRPTADRPLHGAPRRQTPALLAVLGLFAAIALVLVVLTVLRYAT
jgi:hypothetical protein